MRRYGKAGEFMPVREVGEGVLGRWGGEKEKEGRGGAFGLDSFKLAS